MVSQSHKGDRRSNFQGRHSKLAKQCPDLNLYIYYFLDRSLHRRNLVFGAEWLSDGFDVLLVVFRQKEEASLETSTRVRTMHIALGVGKKEEASLETSTRVRTMHIALGVGKKEEASLETSTRVRTMHIALRVGNSICTIFF
jgi:hypothetical protein